MVLTGSTYEDQVESPANIGQRNWSYLSYHGVEGEGGHSRNRYTYI